LRKNTADLTCLILAGGKGTRLRPITNSLPKPLVKVAGKPIIDYAIDHCLFHGVDNFLILSGYLSSKVVGHVSLRSTSHEGINFKVVDSGDVDIIERIRQALDYVQTKYLIILYGDTISDVDISNILKFHKGHDSIATMATWQMRSNFGVIKSNDSGLVVSYQEKPKMNVWMNIGYIVMSTDKAKHIKNFDTFQEFLENLVEIQSLYTYKHNGFHYTVNNMSELQDAEKCLIEMHEKEQENEFFLE
jgi:glucose-1-phosphate cytidylyltransferase